MHEMSLNWHTQKFVCTETLRLSDICFKLIQCNPPFTLTRGLLTRYHEFLGVDVRNAAIPDPFEMIVQPTHAEDAVMVASFKEVVTCGKGHTLGTTLGLPTTIGMMVLPSLADWCPESVTGSSRSMTQSCHCLASRRAGSSQLGRASTVPLCTA